VGGLFKLSDEVQAVEKTEGKSVYIRSRVGPTRSAPAFDAATSGRTSLVFSANKSAIGSLTRVLPLQGIMVSVAETLANFDSRISDESGSLAFLIMELDSFGGISAVIDRLMALRVERPALIIVLLSSKSASHDFSKERLALCDATLAMPCASSDIVRGLYHALQNNSEWQRRLEETEARHCPAASQREAAVSITRV
jgi:hypothetical protein